MKEQFLIAQRLRLGQRIAEVREEQGLTQQQLADRCGLIQQNIDRIEKGRYNTGIDLYSNILQALGLSLEIK